MTTKTVYIFDASTGVFDHIWEAQENPLEPGTFIEPVASTEIAPPSVAANQAAVFKGGAWTVEPDYRGVTWYDQTTGVPVEITTIGQPAANLGATQSASYLAAQAEALAALPNPSGFAQAVKTGMGGIVAANALSVAYPLFFAAVTASEWADVQTLILDAQSKSVINATQYSEIKTAAAANNIPITLP